MAPILTVKDVRTAELTRLQAALVAKQQELLDVEVALAIAGETLVRAANNLANLEAKESTLSQQINAAPMPAAKHAFEVELESTMLETKKARGELADAQDSAAQLARKAERTGALVDRLKAQITEIDAALALARADDAKAARWRGALNGAALEATRDEARGVPTTTLVTAAEAKLAIALGGPEMLALLQSRFDHAAATAADRVAAAERAVDALDTVHATQAPIEGTAIATGDKFARVRERVRVAVETSTEELALAQAALKKVLETPTAGAVEQTIIDLRADEARGVDDQAAAAPPAQGPAPAPPAPPAGGAAPDDAAADDDAADNAAAPADNAAPAPADNAAPAAPAAAAAAVDGVALEIAIHTAAIEATAALAAFDAEALKATAADPAVNPETAAGALAALRQARDTKKAALDAAIAALAAADAAAVAAQDDLTPTERIDEWEVAVSAEVTAAVLMAMTAKATIARIAGLALKDEAGGLLAELDKAEDDYAKALKLATEARARKEQAAEVVAERLDAIATVADVAGERLALAVRGDR